MSIPVRAMHAEVRDNYLSEAEAEVESSLDYSHPIAQRDPVRLAYIKFQEAGNPDIWEEARENWNTMRIAEKNAAREAAGE